MGNPTNLKRAGYDDPGGNIAYDPEFECTGGSSDPNNKQCPFETKESDVMGLERTGRDGRLMHLNMPSFRDPLCPRTLKYLFTKAKRPNDIRVRVLQQNMDDDDDCLETYCKMMAQLREETGGGDTSKGGPAGDACPHRDQIFVHAISAKDAAGPTYARGLIGQDMHAAYVNNEISPQDFCMSTDSHMDFEPEWDEKMVNMWEQTKNEYAVLSTYVASIEQLGVNLNGVHEVPHLCMVTFTSQVRTTATKCARNLVKPKLTNAVWGAGLSFSKCHAELKVPVDPHTPGIFDGEEFNRAARFFTYGYDVYTPNRVFVLHDYHGSQHNPKTSSWGHGTFSHEDLHNAYYRLNTMLDIPGGEPDEQKALQLRRSRFGLGDRRTLDQLIEFSGVDLRHKKATIDGKNRCGNLQWVPFMEHPKGVNFIPTFDDTTEEPLDLPYDKSSVWYDPHFDGAGVGIISRGMILDEKDPKAEELRHAEEKTAHAAFKEEAKQLAGNSHHADEHKRLAAALEEEGAESGRKEVVSSAAAAALKAEQMNEEGVVVFPPLLRGSPQSALTKGKLFLSQKKHGIEHLPIQIKIAVVILIFGLIAALITSGSGRGRRKKNSKKR